MRSQADKWAGSSRSLGATVQAVTVAGASSASGYNTKSPQVHLIIRHLRRVRQSGDRQTAGYQVERARAPALRRFAAMVVLDGLQRISSSVARGCCALPTIVMAGLAGSGNHFGEAEHR